MKTILMILIFLSTIFITEILENSGVITIGKPPCNEEDAFNSGNKIRAKIWRYNSKNAESVSSEKMDLLIAESIVDTLKKDDKIEEHFSFCIEKL